MIYGQDEDSDGEVSGEAMGVLSAVAFDNDGAFEGGTGIGRLQRVANSLSPLMRPALKWLAPNPDFDFPL